MDENYLDSLLNKVSSDQNDINNSFDNIVEEDSGIDIEMSDLDNLSLDELDDFDSLDLGDLELDDIDFDDVDITNLDFQKISDTNKTKSDQVQELDFNLDELISETQEASSNNIEALEFNSETSEFSDPVNEDVFSDAEMQFDEDTSYPNLFEDESIKEPQENIQPSSANDIGAMNLDDLFSALGIDEENGSEKNSYTSNQDSLEELFQSTMVLDSEDGALDDIDDISDVKPSNNKKSKGNSKVRKRISEVLFGEPDEDDIEEDRLLKVIKAEKQIKKENKKAEKEVKNSEKMEKLSLKKEETQRKQQQKNEKQKAKNEALRIELEAEKNEKKVSTATVIIVFAAFTALAVLVVFGTKQFNYSQVIKKASDYFDRQRYRLAYEEVCGVDVKDKDEDLLDRIYTVMYVERLYESYQNNLALDRPDKALDALLRGLEKYDEHYAEAVELDIVSDIDLCKDKIINALWNTYGLSENGAYNIIELTGQEYMQTLNEYCEGFWTGE